METGKALACVLAIFREWAEFDGCVPNERFLIFHAQKIKLFIKGFNSKYNQILRKLQIWSHLLKKALTENLIFYTKYQILAKVYELLDKTEAPIRRGSSKQMFIKISQYSQENTCAKVLELQA